MALQSVVIAEAKLLLRQMFGCLQQQLLALLLLWLLRRRW